MIPPPFLKTLVCALVGLVVAFGVVMGGFALAHATGDTLAASVLWYVGMAILMGLAGNVLLLVAFLGCRAVQADEAASEEISDE